MTDNLYYSKEYVIHEIRKGCKNREVALLSKDGANIRALKINHVFDFNRILKVANWERHKQNFYRSVATLKSVPDFTFNPKTRSSQTIKWFREEYDNSIVKYDLFFDFDKTEKDSWEELIKEVKMFEEYLDSYEVSYVLIFSGNKGFQILIDGDYLDIKEIKNGNVFPHKTIVEKIKEMMGLTFLDLANNGVNSRLCKIPYSLVGENIAYPLKDEQLDNFKIEDMNADKILHGKERIVMRGHLERFSNLDLKQKKRNLANFIKLFEFK